MATALPFTNIKKELHFPKLATFYDHIAQPFAWAALRFTAGAALVILGIPLIKDPLSMTVFFEGIGFLPGHVWSVTLMIVQVFGGILLAIGLYTRPAALAVGVMLLVTLWYHITYPFGTELITRDGLKALTAGSGMLTSDGYALLKDGGRYFAELAQAKATLLSLLWSGVAFLFAAFGGGYLSLDRKFLRKRY
jgi:putative oxidoreductase